jgi:hypothetical protein
MSGDVIPFDRHDAAHPAIHQVGDDPSDELVLAFNGLVDTLQIIEAGSEPVAAALAREALSR